MSEDNGASIDLAQILQAHRDEIVAMWVARLRQSPESSYGSQPSDELHAWMDHNLTAAIEGLSTGSQLALDRYLTDVSLLRLRLGFDISEVIQGLLLLREIAGPFVSRAYGSVPEMDRAVMAELDNYVRYMVGRFGHLYADAMQKNLREEQERAARQEEQLAIIEERQRLARELHDSVTQSLYSMGLYAEAASDLLSMGDSSAAAGHLRQLRDTARDSLREMRLLIFELHPPILEEEGLAGAIHARLEAVEGRGGLEVEWQVDGDQRLPIATEEALYRIAQEALNNVLKHAHARQVTVRLQIAGEGRAHLEVADDGVGFDPALAAGNAGLGLRGMRERAERVGARIAVESAPGRGTKVMVSMDGAD